MRSHGANNTFVSLQFPLRPNLHQQLPFSIGSPHTIETALAMFRFFKSDFFHFETVRLLSFAPYEGGEIAEFLVAVAKIKDLDFESWYSAWMEAGSKAEELADEAELAGNREAARRAFFRAANYQRAAQVRRT